MNGSNIDIYDTSKERELDTPQTSFWEGIANECSDKFISIDLFVIILYVQ